MNPRHRQQQDQATSPASSRSPIPTIVNHRGGEFPMGTAKVSIILPTYNRAAFLRRALETIQSQTFQDWELIVVDDGSTDHTKELVQDWMSSTEQPCRYVFQANQGAYGARNTGLSLSRSKYVAFFDSDDEWLPHHLADCVSALDAHPDVDWVYGACRVVNADSEREIAASTFYVNDTPRPFLRLRTNRADQLHIIADPRIWRCAVLHGLYCGLQNSVIRRSLFRGQMFDTSHRNEAEDQLAVVRSLSQGRTFAYLDNVHVIYHIHEGNSSAAAIDQDIVKRQDIARALVRGYENLRHELPLSSAQKHVLNRRLSEEYFWRLGYALLWQHGQRREALAMFRRGLQLWPWNIRYWKTYGLAIARFGIQQTRPRLRKRGETDA